MASLRRFPTSRFWYACFTMPDGQRVQKSTREINERKAQKMADTFEEASRARQTARQAQRVISEIYARATGETLPTATVRGYFESWLERKQPETAETTFAFYQGKARAFLTFLGGRADGELARLSSADMLAFRRMESERVSSETVNHAIKLLRMIFEQAKRDGILVDNPAHGIALLKKRSGSGRRPFTLPELTQLLTVADPEWRSLIIFGCYTGQRLSDLVRLTWNNVDLEHKVLRFITGKTRRRMEIPLAVPLLRHLIEAAASKKEPKAALHPAAFAILEKEGKSSTLSRQFGELMAKAGLVAVKSHKRTTNLGTTSGRDGKRQLSEISFHALRHTVTSLMKNAGISPAIVGEFIGHESAAMNRIYTHINLEPMRQAADMLPDLTSGK